MDRRLTREHQCAHFQERHQTHGPQFQRVLWGLCDSAVKGVGIEPWYKVSTARREVREGRSFNPDEFAIGLEQLVAATAAEDYRAPEPFFALTCWMRALRERAGMVLRRLSGGTDNTALVLTRITQFGAGKTHTLAALYQLATSGDLPAAPERRGSAGRKGVQLLRHLRALVGQKHVCGKSLCAGERAGAGVEPRQRSAVSCPDHSPAALPLSCALGAARHWHGHTLVRFQQSHSPRQRGRTDSGRHALAGQCPGGLTRDTSRGQICNVRQRRSVLGGEW